jgi:hypothetical protein
VDLAPSLLAGSLSEKKCVIAAEWLERVLETYPKVSCRPLRFERDPFRNPVGHALQQGLSVLVEEILGGMDRGRITPALDGIIRIRAVQDFTAGQSVSFVFMLREVVREHLGDHEEFLAIAEQRIDELAVLAFDLFMACREQIYELKANELKRSMYVQTRLDRNRAVH